MNSLLNVTFTMIHTHKFPYQFFDYILLRTLSANIHTEYVTQIYLAML